MINYVRVRPAPLHERQFQRLYARGEIARLSPRQRQLHRLLIDTKLPTKDIAHVMGVTHGTVKVYASSLYRTIGATSRVDLLHSEIEQLRTQIDGLMDQQEME